MSKKAPKKLWLLERIVANPRPDEAIGFVVRSASMWAARRHAAGEAMDEGGLVWMDPNLTKCTLLSPSGKAGVVIQSSV